MERLSLNKIFFEIRKHFILLMSANILSTMLPTKHPLKSKKMVHPETMWPALSDVILFCDGYLVILSMNTLIAHQLCWVHYGLQYFYLISNQY